MNHLLLDHSYDALRWLATLKWVLPCSISQLFNPPWSMLFLLCMPMKNEYIYSENKYTKIFDLILFWSHSDLILIIFDHVLISVAQFLGGFVVNEDTEKIPPTTSPFALLWCWGTMMFMIILSIEWPSVIAKWKVFAMQHLFFPQLFLLLLYFCLLFPLTSFLVTDMIPYVIVGTCSMRIHANLMCSMSIHVNLMFCCCWASFLPPFFTYRKPITPFKEQRS